MKPSQGGLTASAPSISGPHLDISGPWVHRSRPGRQSLPCPTQQRRGGWLGSAALILLAAFMLAAAGVYAVRAGGQAGTLDLRVIAASNRPTDQAVKLQVRDAVLAVLAPGLAHATSQGAAQAYVTQRLSDVQLAARTVAARAGEPVSVRLGRKSVV